MELLINELMKLGGEKKRFIAKAFGGANVCQG
jgi:chemotaxis receptor (MCP) glutamine deamidase CheD